MKLVPGLILLMFSMLFGCGSTQSVRNTVVYDVIPLDHAIHIYEINFMLSDSVLSDLQIFSPWQPNGFWFRDTSQQMQFAYYFVDVTGREFYLPSNVVLAMKVSEYKIDDDDIDLYIGKCQKMLDYYNITK